MIVDKQPLPLTATVGAQKLLHQSASQAAMAHNSSHRVSLNAGSLSPVHSQSTTAIAMDAGSDSSAFNSKKRVDELTRDNLNEANASKHV
jgi:hypothetical protein